MTTIVFLLLTRVIIMITAIYCKLYYCFVKYRSIFLNCETMQSDHIRLTGLHLIQSNVVHSRLNLLNSYIYIYYTAGIQLHSAYNMHITSIYLPISKLKTYEKQTIHKMSVIQLYTCLLELVRPHRTIPF